MISLPATHTHASETFLWNTCKLRRLNLSAENKIKNSQWLPLQLTKYKRKQLATEATASVQTNRKISLNLLLQWHTLKIKETSPNLSSVDFTIVGTCLLKLTTPGLVTRLFGKSLAKNWTITTTYPSFSTAFASSLILIDFWASWVWMKCCRRVAIKFSQWFPNWLFQLKPL